MPSYCVNKKAQLNGDHEVHDLTPGVCPTLPALDKRLALGYHGTCTTAVQQAKQTYWKSNGCYHCCRSCHTT